MAEDDFHHWCAEVNANAEKTAQDEIGVDFFVTSFWRPEARVSLDKQSPAFSCAVQVKGSDKADPAVPLSLQTWHHLIKSPLPAFVVILHYDGKKKPQRAYLIHIDQVWGAKALKRLRQVEEKAYPKLNKLSMRIRAQDGDELEALDGECLQRRLTVHIGDLNKYIDEKRTWVRNVGYTDKRLSFTVQTPEDRFDELVDFAIGLRSEMPVTITHINETRFGITKPFEGQPTNDSKITTPGIPSSGTGIITLRSPHAEQPAQINCEFFHPNSIFGFIPKKYLRLRFRSDFFDFIYTPSTGAFSAAIDFEEIAKRKLPLQKWLVFFRFLHVQRMPDLKLSLEFDGNYVEIGASASATAYPPEIDEVGEAVEQAWRIANKFGCTLDEPVNLGQLQAQRARINEVYTILHATPDKIDFRIAATPDFIQTAGRVGDPYIGHALVGPRLFVVVYAITGALADTGEPAGNGMNWAKLTEVSVHYERLHTQLVRPDSKLGQMNWREEAINWLRSQNIRLLVQDPEKQKQLAKKKTRRRSQ